MQVKDPNLEEAELEKQVIKPIKDHVEHYMRTKKRTTLFINKGQHKVFYKNVGKNEVLFVKATGNEATQDSEILEIESEILGDSKQTKEFLDTFNSHVMEFGREYITKRIGPEM